MNLTITFSFHLASTPHFMFLILEWALKSKMDVMVSYILGSLLFLSGELRLKIHTHNSKLEIQRDQMNLPGWEWVEQASVRDVHSQFTCL